MSVNAQSISVNVPTSSTVCTGGQSCAVNWIQLAPQGVTGYEILLQNVTTSTTYLINGFYTFTTGNESTSWVVTNGPDFNGTFRVKVTEINGQDQDQNFIYGDFDYSDNFTINRGPYIDITSPTSGVYTNGSKISVDYSTNQSSLAFKLKKLSDNSLTTITLDGNGDWTIPGGQAEGDYKIQITGGSVTEESATFTIEPKRIIVTYPFDNLIFEQGAKPVIRWSANYNVSSFKVWVEDEDNSWTIVNSTMGNSYQWNIPSNFHLDNDFEVYVKDNSSSVTGIQNGKFTIEVPNPESFTLNSAKSTSIKIPISTISQISSLAVDEKVQSVGYVDGTGKSRQSVAIKAAPNQKDVINVHDYDELGQKDIQYLPFILATTSGAYRNFAIEAQMEYYCSGGSCVAQGNNVTSNSHPYSRTIMEKSPLRTVEEQGAPGQKWQPGSGSTIRSDNSANVSGDQIIYWEVNTSGNPKANGYYEPSVIAISKTTDENGNESYVYTNREGQEILKEGFVNSITPVRTYYVYDDFGNLRFIIPPEAVVDIGSNNTIELSSTDSIRTTWLTEMQYDGYHRVVWKKIPEAEPVYTVYDKLGRVALTQDGNMRLTNEWFFTKYDIRGRAILTGTYIESDQTRQSREAMQTYLNSWNSFTWELRETDQAKFPTQHGYTFRTFPDKLENSTIWSVTYYDHYDFNNDGTPDESFEANTEFTSLTGNNRSKHEADVIRTDGMVTGSKTRILSFPTVIETNTAVEYDAHNFDAPEVYYIGNGGSTITLKPGFSTKPGQTVVIGNDNSILPALYDEHSQGSWLEGVTFYDKYGRTIYTKSTNHVGGTDKSWSLYHFDGEVERTKSIHVGNGITTTVRNRFEYDHAGRLLKQYQQNNSQTEVLIAENSYNELGQLVSKELNKELVSGSMVAAQTVDFKYHLRGWLEQVNNPAGLGSDLFAYRLYYDQVPAQGLSVASFNGNIIAQDWATMINGSLSRHRYDYSYDGLNQLTLARKHRFIPGCTNNCYEWTTQYEGWNTSYSYDLNGNIQTLNRAGNLYYNMDQLSYYYSGNQIKAITDNATYSTGGYNLEGFKDGASNSIEYEYDANGNMIRDDNKSIESIRYNKMNLPEVISFTNGNQIVYLYDAAGTKLSKKTYTNGTLGVSTDYVNGYVYTDNVLDFFAFSEGRVRMSGTTGTYEYDLKDHLGNVRATFTSGTNNLATLVQADSYYPFGLKMPTLSYVATGADENKFTYNGKELEDEFGLDWYHYGARFYDPAVARWWAIDPAGEYHSSYSFVGGNPIVFIDPNGQFSENTNPCFPLCGIIYQTVKHKISEFAETIKNDRIVMSGTYDISLGLQGGLELDGYFGGTANMGSVDLFRGIVEISWSWDEGFQPELFPLEKIARVNHQNKAIGTFTQSASFSIPGIGVNAGHEVDYSFNLNSRHLEFSDQMVTWGGNAAIPGYTPFTVFEQRTLTLGDNFSIIDSQHELGVETSGSFGFGLLFQGSAKLNIERNE
ncbi:MAG: DUF6443 domain-containing protein [Balneola sp.]